MSADRPSRAGWLILPVVVGGVIHGAVLKSNVLRRLAVPIDGGATWRGQPIFGANKTWRGVAVMTGSAALAAGMQATLAMRCRWAVALDIVEDTRVSPWLAGAVAGLSYCLAELPNSFVKRRLGIAPGDRTTRLQYLVDQIDSVIGCLLALRLVYRPTRGEITWAFVLGTGIHIAIDSMLYVIGVKGRRG